MMNSDNMDVTTEPKKRRVFISLPKKYMANLSAHYKLDHGLFIKNLNPYLNEGYIRTYFKEWGTVTLCKIMKGSNSQKGKAMAFVRFSTEEEADGADWAGPHYIGGTEVEVTRIVSPKMDEESEINTAPAAPRPRRSMGLGYILEDAQWLEEDE